MRTEFELTLLGGEWVRASPAQQRCSREPLPKETAHQVFLGVRRSAAEGRLHM
jgi:hypothetical protein